MSCIMCDMWHVNCHISLMLVATAMYHPPAFLLFYALQDGSQRPKYQLFSIGQCETISEPNLKILRPFPLHTFNVRNCNKFDLGPL